MLQQFLFERKQQAQSKGNPELNDRRARRSFDSRCFLFISKEKKELNRAQIGAESKQLSPRRISLSTNKNFLLTFAFQCGLVYFFFVKVDPFCSLIHDEAIIPGKTGCCR